MTTYLWEIPAKNSIYWSVTGHFAPELIRSGYLFDELLSQVPPHLADFIRCGCTPVVEIIRVLPADAEGLVHVYTVCRIS